MDEVQHDNWTKVETFSLFGKQFFKKETICRNQNYKGDLIQVTPPASYYNNEFQIKRDSNDQSN